jgi:hypothetical protein
MIRVSEGSKRIHGYFDSVALFVCWGLINIRLAP